MAVGTAAIRMRRSLMLAHGRLHHRAPRSTTTRREFEFVTARATSSAEVLGANQVVRSRARGARAGGDSKRMSRIEVAIETSNSEALGLRDAQQLRAHAGGSVAVATKRQ